MSEAGKLINVPVANLLRRAIAQVGETASEGLLAFARGAQIGAKGDMERIHRKVAADAREATRAAYRDVEADALTYGGRTSRRSGWLGRVLSRGDLARADSEGIEFINREALDTEAAHWYRMNFGAGNNAGNAGIENFPLRIFGQTLSVLSFSNEGMGGPSAPFVLPPGFFQSSSGKLTLPLAEFRGSGTQYSFWPNRKSPYVPAVTEGIRGRHFLEAGMEVIATELPVLYEDMINEWIQKGGRKARAISRLRTVQG